jgi:hypothetical protein
MQRFLSATDRVPDVFEPDRALRDRGRICVDDNKVEGTFDWPYDQIFRPLIGLYSLGRLKALISTVRRPNEAGQWSCYFSAELPKKLRDGELMIACLETGDILYSRPHERRLTGTPLQLQVEDIIEAGRQRTASFNYRGFPSFLILSLTDQINILHYDFCGRFADHDILERYRGKIAAGQLSILDVRDKIVTSDEVVRQYNQISLDERHGRWCLWHGFAEILPYLIPSVLVNDSASFHLTASTTSSLRSAMEEIGLTSDPSKALARLAVGATSDDTVYVRWIQAHSDMIANMKALSAANSERRRTIATGVRRQYTMANLLPAMKIGAVGVRSADGIVRGKTGVAGHLVYGPYMRLLSGCYSLTWSCHFGDIADANARLAIEVVYADILLARQDIRLHETPNESHRLNFTVPSECAILLGQAKFEFRMWSNGGAYIEIQHLSLDMAADGLVGPSAPSVEDWLPLLRPGTAGKRVEGDRIAAQASNGHVFYGPYCFLLPGTYACVVDCDVQSVQRSATVTLEIVGPQTMFLGEQKIQVQLGSNRLEMFFTIPEAQSIEDLIGPLEFRLHTDGRCEFICTRASILSVDKIRISNSVRLQGATQAKQFTKLRFCRTWPWCKS